MAARNPEGIKQLISRMNKEWPTCIIPHICNSDGLTPLKLAYQKRHRLLVGQLLDHLKSYPFGYCTQQVSDMADELIKDKFEQRIGAYLNDRFKTPLWVSGYETGRLKLTDQGMNQTSINNWPAVTKNFEKKFFSKDAREVPTKLRLLDCANLHANENDKL